MRREREFSRFNHTRECAEIEERAREKDKPLTDYNSLMMKAMHLAKERGVREQADLDKIITEVFAEARKNK